MISSKKLVNAIATIRDKGALQTQETDFTQVELGGKVYSTIERVMKDVPPPERHIPTKEEFYDPSDPGKPNLQFLRNHLSNEGRLSESQALWILNTATSILRQEPNVLEVESPLIICGDIHGQYYDLMKVFNLGGDASTTQYLFLGDYVDRGVFGLECVLYLWALKICYPRTMFLLRGNHECRHLTSYFSFRTECRRKLTEPVYEACIESFCTLPLAAIINKQFFCVHGGLSPHLHTTDDVTKIDRFQETPKRGIMCDLLWADPDPAFENKEENFRHNHIRGCSFYFTVGAVNAFLKRNNLLSVIRAHEVQEEGFKMYSRSDHIFPPLVSVFSAPNYCDVYNNKAAILIYDGSSINIRQFRASLHPYWLPNFLHAFEWSLPFLGQKMADMLVAVLGVCTSEELDKADTTPEEWTEVIPAKFSSSLLTGSSIEENSCEIFESSFSRAVRISKAFSNLRKESENVSELKDVTGLNRLPFANLSSTTESVQRGIHSFEEARQSDIDNEHIPPQSPPPYTEHSSSLNIDDDIHGLSSSLFETMSDFPSMASLPSTFPQALSANTESTIPSDSATVEFRPSSRASIVSKSSFISTSSNTSLGIKSMFKRMKVAFRRNNSGQKTVYSESVP